MAASPGDEPELNAAPDGSPRAKVRRFLRERRDHAIEAGEPIRTGDLASQAARYLLEHEEPFVADYLAQMLRPTVADEARRVLGETRKHRPRFVLIEDEYVPETAPAGPRATRSGTFASTWTRYLEYVPGKGHVAAMRMSADDLLLAATERRRRGSVESHYAALWETLRSYLIPGQVVGDVLTEAEVQHIFSTIRVETTQRGDADALPG